MRSKTRSKTRGKTHTRTKTKPRANTRTGAKPSRIQVSTPSTVSFPSPPPATRPGVKACEEVEVGDIGGFGSPQELEEHEKRCSTEATQFCRSCGKNLCNSHYDLLHKDHDNPTGHATGQSMVQ